MEDVKLSSLSDRPSRPDRWVGSFVRSKSRRLSLIITLFALLLGVAATALLGAGQTTHSQKTRMDWFRDAAPDSVGFLQSLWGTGASDAEEPALALITDEVRAQFFHEIPFGDIIHAKAMKYQVDPALIAAIVEVESGFMTEAMSPRGAVGLMQLRPSTGKWMGARNLVDPQQNIDAGTRYLKYLQKRFEGDLPRQLAAYNAGEGTVARYGGIPPYPETRSYIRKVLERYERRNSELQEFHREQLGQRTLND